MWLSRMLRHPPVLSACCIDGATDRLWPTVHRPESQTNVVALSWNRAVSHAGVHP